MAAHRCRASSPLTTGIEASSSWSSLDCVISTISGEGLQLQRGKQHNNGFTGLDLVGTLPPELVKLPYLQEIDFTRNYLNGTIPKEWGSMNLIIIGLNGNRLSGSIPIELANITTLQSFTVEFNQLSGNLPHELGNLPNIQRLFLTSNNFTGELPASFAKLTTLQDVVIQGTGLSGPIPSGISLLGNLTDLRISDLKGSEYWPFPPLNNLKNLKILILRSCNINGTIPEYLGTITTLKTLDLSYNNFSIGSSGQPSCQQGNVNVFASSSMGSNSSGTVSCLKSVACPKVSYSLHINCGGKQVTINGSETYDADTDIAGPSRFHLGGTNWAFSSTGHFLDNDRGDYYVWQNQSRLSMTDAELYMDARVSPISLTYYGFCLGNGNYTVNLHFAEVMFIDGQTYKSLGRRVFDVYIQGNLVLKDFDIAEEVGGVNKAVTKSFSVVISSNTLDIRLYWDGKGTIGIPFKAVYGPLISAISVNPDFTPPSENGSSLSTGAVAGIVATIVVVIFILMFGILWWKGCLRKKNPLSKELKGLDLQTGIFTLRQIKTATNNFNVANKIGEGGFGPVYKGTLLDGTTVAVKQLSSKSRQGNRDQLLLVYEYMENNSLARALFGPEEYQIKLDWPTRQKICVVIARGLAYLHEESRLKIVHRDIKATNVLLDKDLNPKISDFGLAKLDDEDNTHISTQIAGTYGYMAPEYVMHGYLTDKADVYSFGIVALELVSGRSNTVQRKKEAFHLLDWAHLLKEKGNLMELVDKRLGLEFNEEEVMMMINIAFLCTNVTASLRPTMTSVVSMLEGKSVVLEMVSESSEVLDEKKLETMRHYYQEIEKNKLSGTQNRNILEDDPWTASSTSVIDLYPVNLDSSYWEKRG
ncbi:Serine/threonine-protein kinase, active site [Sesbania bispinosa]|nr:Serine/threonine-protein kinase, active site [Sesbania bispinosa]